MARLTESDALQAITDAISTGGGTVSHNDLVASLESAGKGDAVTHLQRFIQMRQVGVRVAAQPDDKPLLTYSLP